MWIPLLVTAVIAIAIAAVIIAHRSQRPVTRIASRGPEVFGAHLEFIYGPLEGHVVTLGDEITTLGSAPGNTVVLPDPAVSRKHLGIRRDPSGVAFELADLGSTNGVYVNGHRLAKRLLVPGDIIRIGGSEMVFHLEKRG
jgi:two-component system, NtrC family, response regulator GlrR